MADDRKFLVRAGELGTLPEIPFHHPLNPRSEIHMRSLGDLAGLARLGGHIVADDVLRPFFSAGDEEPS